MRLARTVQRPPPRVPVTVVDGCNGDRARQLAAVVDLHVVLLLPIAGLLGIRA